jgi:hypothetical protein
VTILAGIRLFDVFKLADEHERCFGASVFRENASASA